MGTDEGDDGMNDTHTYINSKGKSVQFTMAISWKSLCHNEDVMDNKVKVVMPDALGILGHSICRRCGREATFKPVSEWGESI